MSFYDYLKNIFLILIFLQLAPSLIEGIKKQYMHYLEPRTQVGVIKIKGVLYDSSYYAKQLHKFFKNPAIKAIIIRMECPGSASGTGHAIFNEIQLLKKEYTKPIITLVENTCTSGGYLIASATDYIIAPQAALIGNIGAAFPYLFQLHEFIEHYKIHYVQAKAGKYKAIADPFVQMTEDEKALLQGVLDDTYEQFAAHIAKERKISLNNKNEWGDGKIFTSNQALKLGLIDEIGSGTNAIHKLREKALIEGEIEWIYPPETGGWYSFLGGRADDGENSLFSAMINKVCTYIENRYATRIH